MTWTTACPDWERRILSGESLITFPPLFPTEAERGLSVFKELHLKDVPGCPTYGQVGRQWQFDLVSHIFGSCDPESGRRLIREFFLMVGKKNDKSGMASAIMMTALILNWRQSGEFFIVAPTVEVAGNSFKPACGMISSDEDLADLMHPQDHIRQITNLNSGATLKIVAAESDTVGGLKGVGILVEELWLFGKRPMATAMFTEATGGLMARPEGFVIWLTTQSDETPAGVFADKLAYARGVRDGKIDDPAFLPILFEFPAQMIKEKKHLDPKNFYIPNPNLGASVDEETIIREFKKSEIEGPTSMQSFLAKHLNIQIGVSAKAQNWAGADFWEAAGGTVTLDLILERCEVIEIGIDGGGLDDLLGFAVLGREAGTGNWFLWTHAWCHEIALERRKSEAPKYRDFEEDGDLTIVGMTEEGVKQMGDIVRRLDASGLLDRIGVDQLGLGLIVDELEGGDEKGDGKIEHERIVGIGQGYRLNGAIITTEVKVAGKSLIHGGQPLMEWCVGNARVTPKGNAISITKQESGTGKIDPFMATLDAVQLMAMNPEARNQPFVYQQGSIARIDRGDSEPVKKDGNEASGAENLCKRCGKDTKGREFCPNCGMKTRL